MIVTREITLNTRGECDIVDITPDIEQEVAKAEVTKGVVTIFVAGSTAGLTTIEFESGVLADLQGMWERIVPKDIAYAHDRRWGDGNGYSHVRASLLGASLTVPFSNKKLMVGTWQQIVLVDFDNRHRSRRVILQIMGE
ncbi:MAG: secondary thiamine-phosphate synthase enzyme YjbQ [Dehalococcoidales bacterium]|nr:secondary thiamine-phosphate synthase enzyme YjbQ [Dehalococcoidales bacterium]